MPVRADARSDRRRAVHRSWRRSRPRGRDASGRFPSRSPRPSHPCRSRSGAPRSVRACRRCTARNCPCGWCRPAREPGDVLREIELVARLRREARADLLISAMMPRTVCPPGRRKRRPCGRAGRHSPDTGSAVRAGAASAREFLVREPAAELEHHLVVEEARLVERRHAARQRAEPEGCKAVGGRALRRRSAALLPAGLAAARTGRCRPLVVDDELSCFLLGDRYSWPRSRCLHESARCLLSMLVRLVRQIRRSPVATRIEQRAAAGTGRRLRRCRRGGRAARRRIAPADLRARPCCPARRLRCRSRSCPP